MSILVRFSMSEVATLSKSSSQLSQLNTWATEVVSFVRVFSNSRFSFSSHSNILQLRFYVRQSRFSTNTASSLFPFRQGTYYPVKRITMLGVPN
jgi:hypothetical protein